MALSFPGPGRAEQDADELADVARTVLAEVLSAAEPGEHVVLGITNQRSTVVLWDGTTGEPFGPALSWRDTRAAAQARRLAAECPDVTRRTGLPASPHYGAPKVAWALEHWPDARRALEADRLRVGPVSTWLTWKLTGGESFSVDPTNAQRLLLMSLRDLAWDAALVGAAGLRDSALPSILPTDGVFGTARVEGHALSIAAALGDQQAALLGHGDEALDETAAVHLGTGGFVLRGTGSRCVSVPGLLSGLLRADANAARTYLLEGTVNAVGSAFDRVRDMGLLHEDEDVDSACAVARRPVTFLPAWGGLGAPWWSASAPSGLLGWEESTTRADVIAGVVRGIAFLVADVIDALDAAETGVSALVLSGPVSEVDSLCRAVADATARPIHRRVNAEASLEGLARLLAESTGAEPPPLSVSRAATFAPEHDLRADRARFAALRELAIRRGAEAAER